MCILAWSIIAIPLIIGGLAGLTLLCYAAFNEPINAQSEGTLWFIFFCSFLILALLIIGTNFIPILSQLVSSCS